MACSSCGKPKNAGNVTVKSSYIPKVNQPTKMSDIIMNFTIETKKNDSTGANKEDS
jgi:hypothetical protein